MKVGHLIDYLSTFDREEEVLMSGLYERKDFKPVLSKDQWDAACHYVGAYHDMDVVEKTFKETFNEFLGGKNK